MSKIKGFIGETLIYGFGNVFSRLFAMLLIPLYAKFLGKIDYSNLVMLQSVFAILTILLALNSGVFYYYYEYNNLKYRRIVLTSWFYYQLAAALLLFLLLVVLSPFLYNFFIVSDTNLFDLKWSLVLIGVQLFPYIFNITNVNYYRIERKPKSVILIVLLEAVFTLILVFCSLYFFQFGLIGVMVSQIIARLIVSVLYIRCATLYIRIRYFSIKLTKKLFSFAWPFIGATLLSWIIVSVDKFIGAGSLIDTTEVALLALGMQLVLPITVLADMIRMALGPYVMSIRKDEDAESNYQKIFDLTIFSAAVVLVLVVLISPLLAIILTDITYVSVIFIIPLLGFANVVSLAANQFCVSFSLVKKNIYVLYGFIIAGVLTIIINFLFMKSFGFIVSGYSQLIAYTMMSIFLFLLGRKVANLKIRLNNSLVILSFLVIYVAALFFINPMVVQGKYLLFVFAGVAFIAIITVTYFIQQKLRPADVLKALIRFNTQNKNNEEK